VARREPRRRSSPDVEYRVNAFESDAETINMQLKSNYSRKFLHLTVKDGVVTRVESMCGDW